MDWHDDWRTIRLEHELRMARLDTLLLAIALGVISVLFLVLAMT